ncbi:metal-dependent hydrolase [Halapricum desulfuricans]|uniref:Putative membrane protein n=1 Tax=Halapricum desulfuricans TaxID=2841257 RepID=A0A897MSZ4_9EURY|nr:metal-dependent hydrolase [Halapricum desulfuricans]QSG05260.1 putative membrane protein [Halapricum desulfuricans]
MFVGHALLAFALAVLIADWRGWPARRALALGFVAGGFAAIPDVDMIYTAVALDLSRLSVETLTRPSVFWDASRGVHRSITHSLPIALAAGPAFGAWAAGTSTSRRWLAVRGIAGAFLSALVWVAWTYSGPAGAVVVGTFVAAGLIVARLARTRTDLSGSTIALAATAGLLSHPWGDLVTGDPPRLLYPLDVQVFEEIVLLHADPTIHLLGAFALELGVVWLAAVAVARLAGRSPTMLLDSRAVTGVVYGVAAVVLAPPTLDVSYHFVFTILGVGAATGALAAFPNARSALTRRLRQPPITRWSPLRYVRLSWVSPPRLYIPSIDLDRFLQRYPSPFEAAFVALGCVTVALGSYALVYVFFVA